MIQRKLFSELKKHLSQKEITLLIGPRQSGKTTLMRWLEKDLKERGKETLFLNLDIERDRQFFVSQSSLIQKIKLEIGEGKGYVFIDEIQRKENAGLFLKGIYDQDLPYKLIVSGSGSVELKEKIHESLAGRKLVFNLGTVSFEEFVDYKTGYKYAGNLVKFLALDKDRADRLLDEYLNFGGYPRVVTEKSASGKARIIDEIYQSFLEKDISFLLGVKKTADFDRLVKVAADQTGKLVNFSELSNTLGLSLPTVKNYLWYLGKTFIISEVRPYFTNLRKEITRSPIYYFTDLGLRNYALGLFGNLKSASAKGFVFQNLIFNQLKEQTQNRNCQINFWRTKDRAEVDFVLDRAREVIPIEVKYKKLLQPEISKSLRNFIVRYQPKQALVVNLSFRAEQTIAKTKVKILPFYELRVL